MTVRNIMIFKRHLTSFIIIGLAAEVWSHLDLIAEDYFFPLEPQADYCRMSDVCQHDFVPICGQTSEGATRPFNDVCDMFEYNCDEKHQYRHVEIGVCGTDSPSPAEEEAAK